MPDLSNITAVILAGGLGTRLRSVVSDRPKVMAEINCRPFLSHLLEQIAKAGIGRVVVSTGYMAAYIEEHIGLKHKDLLVDLLTRGHPTWHRRCAETCWSHVGYKVLPSDEW